MSYDCVGATRPEAEGWDRPAGYRRYERSVRIGYGDADFRAAAAAVLRWEVKTRSGFSVLADRAVAGEEAFLVRRDADGTVWFTLRSLTRAPSGAWRSAYPLALVAQRLARRRYLRALAR